MKSRFIFGFCGLLIVFSCLFGCGPKLSERDLGTVVEEVPQIEGAEEPYPMPRLGPDQAENEAEHQH
ncbi:MAG: hypothetical protein GX594_18900 [Pirellulaceae bacterium]|nr:hypothetical protein [Pirellulaceae bacterium]